MQQTYLQSSQVHHYKYQTLSASALAMSLSAKYPSSNSEEPLSFHASAGAIPITRFSSRSASSFVPTINYLIWFIMLSPRFGTGTPPACVGTQKQHTMKLRIYTLHNRLWMYAYTYNIDYRRSQYIHTTCIINYIMLKQ